MALSGKLEGWDPTEPIALSLLDYIIVDPNKYVYSPGADSWSLRPRPYIMDNDSRQLLNSISETLTGS